MTINADIKRLTSK